MTSRVVDATEKAGRLRLRATAARKKAESFSGKLAAKKQARVDAGKKVNPSHGRRLSDKIGRLSTKAARLENRASRLPTVSAGV